MKKTATPVHGSRKLMPYIYEILKNNGGELSSLEVLYLVLFNFKVPLRNLKRQKNEVTFSGVYLRKIGVLDQNTKRGTWRLLDEYMNLSFDEAKELFNKKYYERLQK